MTKCVQKYSEKKTIKGKEGRKEERKKERKKERSETGGRKTACLSVT
jgi:hypothetical protein